MSILENWKLNGKKDITDPAEMNHCLSEAIESKDKKTIIELYDADQCDWDNEDSLFDEYDLLVDMGNEIIFE